MSRNFPSLLLSVALLLTAIVLVWFGWYTYNTYNESYEKKLHDIRIEAVRSEIIHYDEILTMSTRMAAATGDLRWEQRYIKFKSFLDEAIQRAINLAGEEYSREATVLTDIAHRKLVDMEYLAIDLIHQGRLDEANAILYDEAYLIQKKLYRVGMARFPITRFTNLRLVELQGIILHLDEVLTMSARMAAITGDVKWETQYHQSVLLLDDAIKESIILAPNVRGGKAAEQTDQANQKLVEMELKAFELIHQGRLDEAHDILFSQSYEEQKQNYASGTEQFIAELNKMSESITRSEYRKVIWNVSAAFFAIALLLIGWLYVLRIIKIWHEEQKLVEEALLASEERYRSISMSSTVAMIISVNQSGIIISWNTAAENIFGYSEAEILGHPLLEIIPERYRTAHVEGFQRASKTEEYRLIGKTVELHGLKKSGKEFPIELSLSTWKQGGTKYFSAIIHDITDRKHADEQLTHQASHDALTGLVNRREFERRTGRLLSTVLQDQSEHALCFMDLDQFKVVNDTCGHTAGDEMLRQISAVLKRSVRHRDTLARLGGDEFGVLIEHCSLNDAHRVATTLLSAINDYQFAWEEHSFKVGVSMGLVSITDLTANLTELLKQADAACYVAKDKGRNRIHVYHAEDSELAQRHGEMQWVERINQALDEDRFCLYAQIIVPLNSSTDKHYELLLRMVDAKGDIIPPGAFLPAAERYNLISKIDQWVIKNAFGLLAKNPVFLKQIIFCSINLSGQSFTDPEILKFIITQLDESGIGGEKLCFEVTETAAISNLSMAMKFITTLKELGCQFALDDFGSGLSSFGYLKNLPVDYLKIDGMFVKDIVDDPIDRAMVKSINEIGKVMGMKTIAEFVENDSIKKMLKEIGVDYAQGYGIGKPQPFDELLIRSSNVTDIRSA